MGEEGRSADGEGGGEEPDVSIGDRDHLLTKIIFCTEPRSAHPLELKFSSLKLVPSCCQTYLWL